MFFEPENEFNERINCFENVLYLGDYVRAIGNEQKDTINLEESYDLFVIASNDLSGINNHVMEGIRRIINLVEDNYGVSDVYLNNPTKLTLETLKNNLVLEINEPYVLQSVSEEKIVEVESEFDNFIIGQETAKKIIIRNLLKLLIRTNNKPLVLMLYGNPGIGKTETAKFLAKQLNGGEIVREQMSMVQGEEGLKYFKYTHHSEHSFSKKLQNRTSNIILLDEFARAPFYIQDSFFQMFDEGVYEDNNYKVDMRKSIIICTSNFLTEEQMRNNIDNALLSRFDALIKYEDFNDGEKELIIKQSIDSIENSILEKYDSMVDWNKVHEILIDNIKGLTNMRHIKGIIEEVVADEILQELKNKFK